MKKFNQKIEVIKGDITTLQVDAIVNAANSSLKGGGGVDGAIHRVGGPSILEQCKTYVAKQGKLPAGEVMLTNGGNLPAKFVIHTVGPIWNNGTNNEVVKLTNCYCNALQLAANNDFKTIAFPNISTGVYGFPKAEAAAIAVQTVRDSLNELPQIEMVYLVCFDEENYQLAKQQVASLD